MSDRPRILVPMDYKPTVGFFLKPSLVERLETLSVDLCPLTYDTHRLADQLKHADGLLIPGGVGDVDPALYSEAAHPTTIPIPNRSQFELALLERAVQTNKPILGLCWGIQIINVFFGGSLIQNISSEVANSLQHSQDDEKMSTDGPLVHDTALSTRAQDIFRLSASTTVNSTHHQAVGRLGNHLSIESKSSDGIVEAVTLPEHPFLWGVQWHPERLDNDTIIPRFLEEARQSRQLRKHRLRT